MEIFQSLWQIELGNWNGFSYSVTEWILLIWFQIRIMISVTGRRIIDLLFMISQCKFYGKRFKYIYNSVAMVFDISFIQTYHITLKALSSAVFIWCLSRMSQGQLLERNGERKGAGLVHKPLRVSVPHFDNSEIIKGYAKTFIGRCMNPKEQDMKALIIILPKIWKMEEWIVGADLGIRF